MHNNKEEEKKTLTLEEKIEEIYRQNCLIVINLAILNATLLEIFKKQVEENENIAEIFKDFKFDAMIGENKKDDSLRPECLKCDQSLDCYVNKYKIKGLCAKGVKTS